MEIAAVVVNKTARALDKLFHYRVPDALTGTLSVGMLVAVPFGKADTLTEAYIMDFPKNTEYEELKEIHAVLEKRPLFDEQFLELIQFMKQRYFSTWLAAIKTVIPYGMGLSAKKVNDKVIKGASLAVPQEEALEILEAMRDRAPTQAKIIELLLQNDFVANSDIRLLLGCAQESIRSLTAKGVLAQVEIEVFRNPIDYKSIKRTRSLTPTPEQEKAIRTITEALDRFFVYLLHGVTGSGKTEVFLQCIEAVLAQNKTAIVLVPEISLTPQMISRFAGRFGEQIAVLHSRLSLGERNDEYKRIKNGEARVVIGARSAVFAPLSNLGLIVMDEEHELTYKSQNIPSYHAREVAAIRAKQNGIPLLLASATPSVETYYKAQTGKYKLLTLANRTNSAKMPPVFIADMRRELIEGNRSLFSGVLKEEIAKNLAAGQQTILFLNRRGFSTFVSCRSCGYTANCPRCNIALTYHKNRNFLTCHYCGYTARSLSVCPDCGSTYIKHFGTGTQRVEEEIGELFPDATVLRMDLDTVSAKNSHQQILDRFEKEKTDILIGTQMVTKGLDFENVTLVGVLAADMSLHIDDYRANERTFDLITQVCGRAGRGRHSGRAVIQTYSPENSVITLAQNQDYPQFYTEEIALRKTLGYPPFCTLISILFTSVNDTAATACAQKTAAALRNALQSEPQVEILGPAPCGFYKMNNKFRKRILIKCQLNDTIMKTLADSQTAHYKARENRFVSMAIETNPIYLS
ncbi:MAG: primosomal protein N' [Ruminococcaceae bacterium]|nr:primosomal protein N' [Oscillospiraceae bacterium]